MDWYCSLAEHILQQDNIVVGNESFQPVQQQLEHRIVTLYKALLLYQMKSACSFYSHQGWVFLRGLANLDDWDADLKNARDAESALQADLDQFNTQHAKSLLGRLVEIAKEREAPLRDIVQALQDNNALRKEIHRDERDMQCLQDLRLTDPRHDKTRIEQTKGGLLQGAYSWVFDNAAFRQWRDSDRSRLLWIKGDPGKGKTMLLCGIVDELSVGTRLKNEEATTLLSYFFCQATDSRIHNATAVLRGLIYLLLDQQPSLIPHARPTYDHAGKALFEDVNGWVALSEILTDILQDPCLESTYLVIDALDECVVDLPKLLDLIVSMSSLPRVKWIVSSRKWSNIEERLNLHDSRMMLGLELKQNAEQVSHGVDAYIDHQVSELVIDEGLRDQVRHKMRERADGTFLWASLIVKELKEVKSWEVLEVLEEMPVDLKDIYHRMMKQIRGLKRRYPELCRHVLSAATTAYRPLHLAELGVLSGLPPDISSTYESIAGIVNMCGSFLTIRDDIVYTIHQSAQDFLTNDTFLFPSPSSIAEEHYTILSRSLQVMSKVLRRDIYGLKSRGFSIDDVKQPDPDPLVKVRYSCVYWVDHLQRCDLSQRAKELQDGGSVELFLSQSYLYWLESLSLLRSMSGGVRSMTKLDGLLQVRSIHSHVKLS